MFILFIYRQKDLSATSLHLYLITLYNFSKDSILSSYFHCNVKSHSIMCNYLWLTSVSKQASLFPRSQFLSLRHKYVPRLPGYHIVYSHKYVVIFWRNVLSTSFLAATCQIVVCKTQEKGMNKNSQYGVKYKPFTSANSRNPSVSNLISVH